jgi:hypothetical protein
LGLVLSGNPLESNKSSIPVISTNLKESAGLHTKISSLNSSEPAGK